MRIAILGRSELLLQTAHYLQQKNHTIALVGTARSETHYRAHEDDFEKFVGDLAAMLRVERIKPITRDYFKTIENITDLEKGLTET